MDIKIVKPDATYAETLSKLGARLFADTFAEDNPPDDMQSYLDSAYKPEIQTKELNDPTVTTYMAFDQDSNPVAFCQLRQNKNVYDFIGDPDAIELQRIYVDKRCAGKGVGKKLLEACIATANEMGKKTMWLGVWEHNPNAIKFYEKHGFLKVGAHTFQVGNKMDTDHIMIKPL